MGKKYNNLISTTAGFNYAAQQPLDDREVVETYSDLTGLVSSNVAYEGMEVYVVEKQKAYKLINTEWKAIATEAYIDTVIPSWVKADTKPTYTAEEVGALPQTTKIPTALSELTDDTTHRVVTDTDKETWNAKSNFSGNYNDLSDKPTLGSMASKNTVEKSDLSDDVQTSLGKADSAIQSIDGLATEDFVTQKIEEASVGGGPVDQTYDATSSNAQSGTAVAGAIDDFKTKFKTINNQSLIGEGDITIGANGVIVVDSTYNPESLNAQSGTAVAEAVSQLDYREDGSVMRYGGEVKSIDDVTRKIYRSDLAGDVLYTSAGALSGYPMENEIWGKYYPEEDKLNFDLWTDFESSDDYLTMPIKPMILPAGIYSKDIFIPLPQEGGVGLYETAYDFAVYVGGYLFNYSSNLDDYTNDYVEVVQDITIDHVIIQPKVFPSSMISGTCNTLFGIMFYRGYIGLDGKFYENVPQNTIVYESGTSMVYLGSTPFSDLVGFTDDARPIRLRGSVLTTADLPRHYDIIFDGIPTINGVKCGIYNDTKGHIGITDVTLTPGDKIVIPIHSREIVSGIYKCENCIKTPMGTLYFRIGELSTEDYIKNDIVKQLEEQTISEIELFSDTTITIDTVSITESLLLSKLIDREVFDYNGTLEHSTKLTPLQRGDLYYVKDIHTYYIYGVTGLYEISNDNITLGTWQPLGSSGDGINQEVIDQLNDKADKDDVYTKTEIDDKFSNVGGNIDTYSKAEINIELDKKADKEDVETELGKVQTATDNANNAADRANDAAKTVSDVIGERTFINSSDFVNGMFALGTGIADSIYWIITPNAIPITKGEKIKIKPNGQKVTLLIESVSDLSTVTTHLSNKSNIVEDTEIVSEYDGFLFVQVSNNGYRIAPETYACEIAIGTTRIETLEDEVGGLKEDVTILEEKIADKRISFSLKQKPFTRIINDCQTTSDWTITNTSADISSVDTTNFIIGTQSLHSDKQMRCIKNTYNLLENDLVVKIKINSIDTNASLYLSIGTTKAPSARGIYELARGLTWTTPNDWQEIAIPYRSHQGTNSTADFSSINDLIFYSFNGEVDWNLQYVGIRPKTMKKGIVTFTFDDGYKSQYTGLKILAEKGITGTLFHIKEATEKNSSGVYLTLPELQELVNYYGTDIEVHGDPSYDQWNETDLVEHWKDSQAWLKENGLGEGKYMAYPNGIFPENVVQLAKGYFDSCRTIIPFIPLESYPVADRYRVRAVSSVGSGSYGVDLIKSYIDKAVASGAWLILVFHKIEDGTGGMYCSETDLKAIADYAIDSGAYIMNYAEVFESGNIML